MFDQAANEMGISRNELLSKLVKDFLGADAIAVDNSVNIGKLVDPLVRRELADSLIQDAVAQLESKLQSEFKSQISDLAHKVSNLSADLRILSGEQKLGEVNRTDIQILKQKLDGVETKMGETANRDQVKLIESKLESLEKNMAETAKKPNSLTKVAA
ncbi:MAG: hypothetical protein ACK5QS_17550 [Pseudanabaenaceae cyanobacterium]